MPLYVIPQRYALRGATAAELAARNEVLLDREFCQETDTKRFKLGDGSTRWLDLPYAGVGGADLTGLADGNVLVYNATTGLFEPGTGAYSDENARDAFAAMIAAGTHTGINFTYDDANDKISATVTAGAWTMVKKTADETVTNSTTFQDDDTLQIALAASTTYVIKAKVFYTTHATPDFKYQTTYSGTFDAAGTIWERQHTQPGTPTGTDNILEGRNVPGDGNLPATGITGNTGLGWFTFDLVIKTTTSGTLKIQWAQNTADAVNSTKVLAGSRLEYQTF